jgi:outer membrane protein assembly factor BamB
MKYFAMRFVVAPVAALAIAYGPTSRVHAADSAPARTTNTSASTATSTGALNLGKQATSAKGELSGVDGYTKYAAEVTGAGPNDWPMWGGTSIRNNTPATSKLPAEWNPGEFDENTGAWKNEKAKNIKWVTPLGSQSYGNPVVANGKIFVGTNNGGGYLKRYPSTVDLGVLLCFDEKTGQFLWQDSSEKMITGRENDWPFQGICCAPYVEGNRLYYVTSRGEVKCLDTEGFRDGKNDGDVTNEKEIALKRTPKGPWEEEKEADIVWVLDMMKDLFTQQHNMCSCSITGAGDVLFVNTSNGVDAAHINVPAPSAPSFIAVDKRSGKVLWTDNSPGSNILHGQWSSPTYAIIDRQPQVIFGAGDGWVYSFDPQGDGRGKSKLLWKFDCNPKKSKYVLGSKADRNHIIGTPVIYQGLVYVAVGEDPEHGEGVGHLWCIDPKKSGDVSSELVFNSKDPSKPIAHKRNQACVEADGDFTRANPNSAAVWHYEGEDLNHDGKLAFEETMHRTCGTATIKDDILMIADFSGLVHCLDAKTGKCFWTHDLLSACWSSPLIADGKVYIGNEDGKITVFKFGKTKEILSEIDMGSSVYSTPIVANGVLYVSTKSQLFAIQPPAG